MYSLTVIFIFELDKDLKRPYFIRYGRFAQVTNTINLRGKKMKLIKASVLSFFIFSILFINIFKLFYQERSNPLMYKQWYLNNKGDIKTIADCDYYSKNTQIIKDVDIDFLKMKNLLLTLDMKKEVVVALIDTGVDFNHEDLVDSMWVSKNDKTVYGFNFCNNTYNLLSSEGIGYESSHGTKCAGIIAARDNKTGIIGVASMANVKIMSLKILENEQNLLLGDVDNLIKAILFAEDNGAQICNLSLSTEIYNEELEAVIQGSKMLFVVSAGNGKGRGINIDKVPVYPASFNFNNVITVANLSYDGKLNKSSNYGINSVDLAAPGTCIYSTSINNTYNYSSGTSMAAPIVTGIAALVYSQFEHISASEVKKIIIESAIEKEELKNAVATGGIINGAETIKTIISYIKK